MKKNLIISASAAVALLIAAIAYKPITLALKDTPVEKSIDFSVYSANNYNSAAYNHTFAQVHIIVEKVSKQTRSIVWEKTMDARLLKQYPTADKAISQKVTVPGIFDKKEHLEVKYILIYDSKGSQLEMQDGTVVSTGAKQGKVNIGI
jgi:hypothetical protein